MNDLISVIIPFYKSPLTKLRLCIESFIRQSYKNFELLIIDDGNPENIDYLKEEYEKRDARIRFIRQKNGGVSAARNHGVDIAMGKYIVFCDSDDYVESNYLQSLLDHVQGYELAVCGIAEQWFPIENIKVDMRIFSSFPSRFNWIQYVNFSVNKIYCADILNTYHIRFDTEIRLGEDALFLMDYIKHCKRIHCFSSPLYHYVPNNGSAVHQYDSKYWEYEYQVIDKQYKFFNTYPLSEKETMFMRYWLYIKLKGVMYYYMNYTDDYSTAKKYIEKVIVCPYFSEIFIAYTKNKFFNKKDRVILCLWRIFGKNGIFLTKYLSILKNSLK